jgi:hypothetical protein
MNLTSPESDLMIPNDNKVNRSKKIVDAMLKTGKLSQAGYEWLKLATDPWHDTQVRNCKGIPDLNQGSSVVCSVTQTMSISKPGAFASNWSCRISANPVASSCSTENYYTISNSGIKVPDIPRVMWPVQVDFIEDGVPFPEFGNGDTLGLKIPDEYLRGPYKIAGLGIEVFNTTATINKQGTCTTALMNQSGFKEFTMSLYDTGPQWVPATCFQVRSVPTTLADMTLLPGNTQWPAEEGHYSVVPLTSLGTLPPAASPIYPLWTDDEFDVVTSTAHPNWRGPALASTTYPSLGPKFVPTKNPGFVPLNSPVAFYTGLSQETTLTLRVRWIIERFPNDNESSIVVLSTPTAHYDPVALEIYSRLMMKTPPAVMFKENPQGEWWKTMLAGIADIAQDGLLAIPHPLAQGAGQAIKLGRAILSPHDEKEKKEIEKLKQENAELLKLIKEMRSHSLAIGTQTKPKALLTKPKQNFPQKPKRK